MFVTLIVKRFSRYYYVVLLKLLTVESYSLYGVTVIFTLVRKVTPRECIKQEFRKLIISY